MQKVAAYLLERRDGMDWHEARAKEAAQLQSVILNWLKSKGGDPSAVTGAFTPEDDSSGEFITKEATDSGNSWWMLELVERAKDGRIFKTSVSITSVVERIYAYITLEAGWHTSHIVPGQADPRCPRIVRNLLALRGRWYHGSSTLRPRQEIATFEEGETLAEEIKHLERTLPIVVVSTENGEPTLPDLDQKLAQDLAAVANVVAVGEDAAWGLTDALGLDFCCYRGAVRLYWPNFSLDQDRYLHPLWTAERLRSAGLNALDTRERFRKQLRETLYHAATLSVAQPRESADIREGAGRRMFRELTERATSLADYEKIAVEYFDELTKAQRDRAELEAELVGLRAQVAKLESDKDSLKAHLDALKAAPSSRGSLQADAIEPSSGRDVEHQSPRSNETRYYKKVHSTPNHDVMERVADCRCNNWESSHAADKARKGIAKLEKCEAWKSMQHCASCTGGGMWRVRW